MFFNRILEYFLHLIMLGNLMTMLNEVLKLDGKKMLVTLQEPFKVLIAVSHQPANLDY